MKTLQKIIRMDDISSHRVAYVGVSSCEVEFLSKFLFSARIVRKPLSFVTAAGPPKGWRNVIVHLELVYLVMAFVHSVHDAQCL